MGIPSALTRGKQSLVPTGRITVFLSIEIHAKRSAWQLKSIRINSSAILSLTILMFGAQLTTKCGLKQYLILFSNG
jgi:hypothetical protein